MELLGTVARVAALCVVAAGAAQLFKKTAPEMEFLLFLAAVLLSVTLLARPVSSLLERADALLARTGLSTELFAPLFKTLAIALIVRLTAALCRDAGAQALAAAAELTGTLCAVLVSLPLLDALLSLLEGWL